MTILHGFEVFVSRKILSAAVDL